ncbi:MAG: hypothetical protein ACLT98_01150 [Eggerthellaceae bacterium]
MVQNDRWLLPIGARRRIKGIGKGLLLLIGRYRCLAVAFLWTVGSESRHGCHPR